MKSPLIIAWWQRVYNGYVLLIHSESRPVHELMCALYQRPLTTSEKLHLYGAEGHMVARWPCPNLRLTWRAVYCWLCTWQPRLLTTCTRTQSIQWIAKTKTKKIRIVGDARTRTRILPFILLQLNFQTPRSRQAYTQCVPFLPLTDREDADQLHHIAFVDTRWCAYWRNVCAAIIYRQFWTLNTFRLMGKYELNHDNSRM